MNMMGQSRSLGIFICIPKIRECMVIRSTFLFSHLNKESKTDYLVIMTSLAFAPETKMSPDSLCPTILILPHPTLLPLLYGNPSFVKFSKKLGFRSLTKSTCRYGEKSSYDE